MPYGPGGWLVEVPGHEVIGYAAAVRAIAHHAIAEVVPGARTVLVRVAEPGALDEIGAILAALVPQPVEEATARTVEIPVTYDGEDLADVAAATGLSTGEVAERHATPTYTCAFCGFAPGFAYLVGLDPALHLPRRSTPRTRVSAGSVAIAAEYSAVYPSASPGGWHVIGQSTLALWDPLRERAALVEPGTSVRFVPVGAMTELVVESAGWATTIQDAGRHGHAAIGVPPSGSVDGPTRELLNRLVGNPPDAAVVETLGGLRVRATVQTVVATSAEFAPAVLAAGDTVVVAPADGALWGYLAVRGGIAVDPVMRSRSEDSRSGLGRTNVIDGSTLPVGPDPGTPILVDQAPPPPLDGPVGVWPGPRVDWFAPDALERLVQGPWTVSGDVSRVGARLDGPPLRHARDGQLPSEGLLTGAIQVPPDGRPVVMLADHPTTGGYPVLAVVDPAVLHVVGQSRPGAAIRFRLLH